MEIVQTPKFLGPSKIGALGLSLFSLMVNPRLGVRITVNKSVARSPERQETATNCSDALFAGCRVTC